VLSGHGIKQFRVRSEEGHVTPARSRRGAVGFLSFLAAAMAPLYIPPALVLIGLIVLVDRALVPWATAGPGFMAAVGVLQALGTDLPLALVLALANLDLAAPAHIVVFLLVLLGVPGSRPSHVKGSRFHGKNDEGDVAVIRRRIRANPWPFVLFIGLLYVLYFPLVKWLPQAYWWPFQAVWAVALTGIVLALFGAAWWSIAAINSRAPLVVAWLAPALFVAAQVAPRMLDWGWSIPLTNGVAVAAWALAAIALGTTLARRHPVDRM
jgi:hypothetical protein